MIMTNRRPANWKELQEQPYQEDTDRGLPEFGYWHNVVADKENCVLLP